jgi:hypothetical protein
VPCPLAHSHHAASVITAFMSATPCDVDKRPNFILEDYPMGPSRGNAVRVPAQASSALPWTPMATSAQGDSPFRIRTAHKGLPGQHSRDPDAY